ncbi:phosphotransferase enzyme family protein [Kitasatospora sp. NPDC092286]|uniref:phosphotransferase enzyme family protein n=1 Tax=Kitasatospora sp. NPDC092286 TaxID=3364087 RepID=UPI0038063139
MTTHRTTATSSLATARHTSGGRDSAMRTALEAAATTYGLPTAGARILQDGLNLVVRLPDAGLVAKVYRPGTTLAAAVRLSRLADWLRANDVLVPAPHRLPLFTEGRLVVSFMEDLGSAGAINPQQFAALLRHLHTLTPPPAFGLPAYAPADSLAARLRALPGTTPASRQDLEQLLTRLAEVARRWLEVDWPGGTGLLHGDAGYSNTVLSPAGPALIDWDYASIGPVCVDLALEAWHTEAFDTPVARYRSLARAYGLDITRHDGADAYALLRSVLAITGVIVFLEAAADDPRWAGTAAHRLACVLGDEPLPWHWRIDPALTGRTGLLARTF